jgi:asparagine N-glycosylation enzyme membrane subunit Stt3
MPLVLALAAGAVIYLVRSIVRGFDFRPDLPMDVVVLVALLVAVGAVAYIRADDARRDELEAPHGVDTDEDEPVS